MVSPISLGDGNTRDGRKFNSSAKCEVRGERPFLCWARRLGGYGLLLRLKHATRLLKILISL